jgi:O-antigen/teichoic acid export membrane protein
MKAVVTSVSLYTLASLSAAGFSFLFLPIITRILSSDAIGMIFMFQTLTLLCVNFVSCGSMSVVQSVYFELDSRKLSTYIVSAVTNSFLISILVFFTFFVFRESVSVIFKITPTIVVISAGIPFLTVLHMNMLALHQIREKPLRYFILYVLLHSVTFLTSVTLVMTLFPDHMSRVLGVTAATVIASIYSIKQLREFIFSSPNISVMKELALRGWPIIFHSSSMLIIAQTDKFLIANLLDIGSVGLYGVSSQLASVIGLLAGAMVMAYTPILYKRLSSETRDDGGYSRRVLKICIFSLLIFCICYVSFASYFHDAILGRNFDFQAGSFLILCMGGFLFGTYHFFSGYFYYFKRTKFLAALTISIALINFALTYYLLPIYGLEGAAMGSFLAYATACAMATMFSNRCEKTLDSSDNYS